jgi:hypothetical protein
MSKEKTTQKTEELVAQLPPNRRQRRYMMKQNGMLRYLSKLNFFHPTKIAVRTQNMENARKIQGAMLDVIEKAQAERLEATLRNLKETWANIGYNDSEITQLEEAWAMTTIKDRETYRQDKKEARRIMKEANASLLARNNK